MKICGLDLVYTLFVGSFYIVDLSQSRFGSFVYAHASDWFFSFLSHMDLSCIRTLDLRLLCFCRHFVDQAIDLVAGLYRCATFSSSSETSRRNEAQHILLAFIFVV